MAFQLQHDKKGRDWLDANNIDYVFHDFKKQGIDETTINNWLTQYPGKNSSTVPGLPGAVWMTQQNPVSRQSISQ